MDNEKFNTLMYWLIKTVAKYDFSEFLEEIGLTLEEYTEIRDYLKETYEIKPYV
jgi:5-bromo-4-chloroindolyl phosphate hydrolysis protein